MSRRSSSVDIDLTAISSIVRGVESTLNKATTEDPETRGTNLSELYKDLKSGTVAFETDTETETETETDTWSMLSEPAEANDVIRCFDYFYEAVAAYYEAMPEEAEAMQNTCTQLYANDFFPSIYALIFHRWLLLKKGGGSLNLFNLFLKGANHLFRSDLETRRTVFLHLHSFAKEDVVCFLSRHTDRWLLSRETLEDLASLVAKYHLYYGAGDGCVGLARRLEPVIHSVSVGDVFYREALLLLNSVQSENSLMLVLEACTHLRSLEASPKFLSRLQSALYEFSTPGGPRYPSRPVRHKAAAVLDSLFPGGAVARRVINAGFRLVHTYSWPSSVVLFGARAFSSALLFPYHACKALFYSLVSSSDEPDREQNERQHKTEEHKTTIGTSSSAQQHWQQK